MTKFKTCDEKKILQNSHANQYWKYLMVHTKIYIKFETEDFQQQGAERYLRHFSIYATLKLYVLYTLCQ